MSSEFQTPNQEPEFSFKNALNARYNDVKYLFRFKSALLSAIIIGALGGAVVSWLSTPTYTARLTFVVDDSKSGGGGGLSAIAGQFGFNLDGMGGSSGVLAGDNVQELLKSQDLIKATLQTPYSLNGKESLADKYAHVNKLDKKWLRYSPNEKPVVFPTDTAHYNRLQDSLLHEMTKLILTNEFGIAKTDKKLGFFEVDATMKDERLALLFCTRMISQATEFYIRTKTTRLRSNVNRLQHRADSIGAILTHKTYTASSANQTLLDLNPAYTSANANVEVKERDKSVLGAIFSETVKNLEASKTMLAQETPTVQIVDNPELPLIKNRLKYPKAITIGILVAVLALSLYLVFIKKPRDLA